MSSERMTPEYLEATAKEMLALADQIESWQLPDPSQAEGVATALRNQREGAQTMLQAAAAIRAGEAYVIE